MTSERAAVDRAPGDLRVFIANRESRCDDCGDDLGRHATIFLASDRGAVCLTCADLDHLTFLPPGRGRRRMLYVYYRRGVATRAHQNPFSHILIRITSPRHDSETVRPTAVS